MRTGPQLGGGPGVRPAPTLPVGPRGCVSATASAHGGILMSGSRLCQDPGVDIHRITRREDAEAAGVPERRWSVRWPS